VGSAWLSVSSIAVEVEWQADLLELRREAMPRCANRLNLTDRTLLDLRYVPGASVKEIALQLGRPANSVCKSLARIRHALLDCTRPVQAGRAESMTDRISRNRNRISAA
jgi:DNA-directed RNA polymerase specialized sigma24 family protein